MEKLVWPCNVLLNQITYAHFDFLSAVSTHDVERIIMNGVGSYCHVRKGTT